MIDSWWTTGASDATAVLTIEKLEAAIDKLKNPPPPLPPLNFTIGGLIAQITPTGRIIVVGERRDLTVKFSEITLT